MEGLFQKLSDGGGGQFNFIGSYSGNHCGDCLPSCLRQVILSDPSLSGEKLAVIDFREDTFWNSPTMFMIIVL